MEFKDKVLYARAVLNLTQEQLAKELHVTYITINRWEHGKIKPTRKAIIQFENFCKMNKVNFNEVETNEKN